MLTEVGIENIELDKLELDTSNPRLPEVVERTQTRMLQYIAMTTSIEDLMSAIAQNGFFPGEPLVVVERDDGKYVVVEGNRRLTAVKLIHSPIECGRPSARMLEISAEAHASGKISTLLKLPVIVRKTREEILPYLGFRHITGVKQWEPLAKARYIEQLFNLTNVNDDPNTRYFSVARAIGSRKDHIKRNLDALAVYKILEENGFYDIASLDEESIKFSILSTALADDRIGKFVGIFRNSFSDDSESTHPIINSSAINRIAAEELTRWLYEKDEKNKTRVGESRNIRELAAVIESPKALLEFRNGADLKVAYQLTNDSGKDFIELLFKAESALIEAAGMVATTECERSSYEVAKRINKLIKMIGTVISEKMVKEDDDF